MPSSVSHPLLPNVVSTEISFHADECTSAVDFEIERIMFEYASERNITMLTGAVPRLSYFSNPPNVFGHLFSVPSSFPMAVPSHDTAIRWPRKLCFVRSLSTFRCCLSDVLILILAYSQHGTRSWKAASITRGEASARGEASRGAQASCSPR